MPRIPATMALIQPTLSDSPINPPRKMNINSITKPKSAFSSSLSAH